MIQITKKRCSIAFQPKWKKTKSQDLLINLLCFSKKIFEDKVKSESFDRFVKTNQQMKMKMKQWKQTTAVYYSLLWILVKNRHKWTQRNLFTVEFAVDHLRWSTRTQWKKSVQNLQLRNPKKGLKRRKKICGLRKAIDTKRARKLDCCGPWVRLNGQHKAQRQSGLGFESTQKWNFFEKENSTQNGCTQRKWLRIWLQINTIWIEWTRKNEALAAKFQC